MSPDSLGYSLASSVSWGTGDFIAGFKARTLSAVSVLLPGQLTGLALAALILAGHGRGWPGASVLSAMPAAVGGTLGLLAFLRGMAVGSMSVVAPIAGTSAVVPVVFGIATGDRLATLTAIGIAAAIVGVVLASREREQGRRVAVAAGAGWALLAALGWGFYFPGMHAAGRVDPYWAVLVFRCTSVTLTAAALLAVRAPWPARRHLPPLAAAGALDVGGNLLYGLASETGIVSVVSVLASLYPIVTVALATIVLRERPTGWQWVGVALTFAGIGLIAAG